MTHVASRAATAAAVTSFVACAALTFAQTPKANTSAEPKTAEQHLDEAKRILDGVSTASVTGDASKRFFDLKRDFNELMTAYGTKDKRPAASTGTSGAGAPGAVGGARESDWRTKYTIVSDDLRDLVGSGSNMPAGSTTATKEPPSGGVSNLDAAVRGQLRELQSRLQMFYETATGQREKPRPEK